MSSLKKLADVAGRLDNLGLFVEADIITEFIKNAGTRTYAIVAKGKVGVRAQIYKSLSDIEDPPVNSHVRADGTITVYPVENDQVVESKVVFTKKFAARNLEQLKTQMASDIATLKTQYSPASFDESWEFYPV